MTCSCQRGSETALVAAVTEPLDHAFPVPAYPPASWFTDRPEWLTPDTKIGVDDQGRVAGYFYHAGQCLVHDASACPRPSPTGYAAFHQQEVAIDTGELVRVGVIGNTNGHADPYARVDVAQAHYADPDRQLMAVRAYDDERGGYILGAMVPHATYGDVALVRRAALSGDWRPMPAPWWQAHGIQGAAVRACEGYDCIGPTLVTRPGLPLVQQYGQSPRAAAILGGAGGIQLDEQERIMGDTVIDVNGTKITVPSGGGNVVHQPAVAPGPHPVPAVTAAVEAAQTAASPPPPPSGNGGGGEADAPAESDTVSRAEFDELAGKVDALAEAVGQLIDQMSAPMAAAAALPPAE